MSMRKHSFISIPLKLLIFIFLKNQEELERMKLDLTNFLLKLPKYPYIYSIIYFKIWVNSNIFIK